MRNLISDENDFGFDDKHTRWRSMKEYSVESSHSFATDPKKTILYAVVRGTR